MAIFYYLGITQLAASKLAWGMSVCMGTTAIETLGVASNIMLNGVCMHTMHASIVWGVYVWGVCMWGGMWGCMCGMYVWGVYVWGVCMWGGMWGCMCGMYVWGVYVCGGIWGVYVWGVYVWGVYVWGVCVWGGGVYTRRYSRTRPHL